MMQAREHAFERVVLTGTSNVPPLSPAMDCLKSVGDAIEVGGAIVECGGAMPIGNDPVKGPTICEGYISSIPRK